MMILNLLGVAIGGYLVGSNMQENGSKSIVLFGLVCSFTNTIALYNLLK